MNYSDEGPSTERHRRQPRNYERERALAREGEVLPEFLFGERLDSCCVPWGLPMFEALQFPIDEKPSASSCGLKSTIESPRPRPLDLADDFKIVEGVPTFTWADPLYWTSFNIFALSFDKTRMALVEKETKICVYDLLDNFALIAESEKRFNRVNCVAFPRTQNDAVIAVHENSTISFLSAPMDDSECKKSRSKSVPQKLRVIDQHCIFSQYNFLDTVCFLIACHTSESWVFASNPNTPNELNLISVSKQEYRKVKILTDERVRPRTTFMSIPRKALVSVVETEANNTTRKTWVWKGIDFKEEVIQQRPIEIEGQGMGFSDCGMYFLLLGDQQRRQGVLALYNIETLEGKHPQPISATLLPDDIMDLKAKLFDQNSIQFSHEDLKCGENIPIVALLVAHQYRVSLSFWDPHRDETLKQIEFTTSSMVWSPDAKLKLCISPSQKWIALGGWSSGRFGLFSLESESLLWVGALSDEELARWPYSMFEFDASNTKLVVNCSKKLYAFAPPCLIEDYEIEMCGEKYQLCADGTSSIALLKSDHRRLLPKGFVKTLMLLQLGWNTKAFSGRFDVALSKISCKTALLIWKKSAPFLLVGSLDAVTSAPLSQYFIDELATCCRREGLVVTDVSEVFSGLQLPERSPSASLFLYPNRERSEDCIVIFALNRGLLAAFKDSASSKAEYIHFSFEKCAQIRQSNDGQRVTCAMPSGVMIIDLVAKEQLHFVKCQNEVVRWLPDYSPERVLERARGLDKEEVNVGCHQDKKGAVYIVPDADDRAVKREILESRRIVRCRISNVHHSLVGFLELNELLMAPASLGLVSSTRVLPKENRYIRIDMEEWNPHIRRTMDVLLGGNLRYYTFQFNDGTGHLWIKGITKEESSTNLVFVPVGAFSLDHYVPCLYLRDYPASSITMAELVHVLGGNLFTMTFNGNPNYDILLRGNAKNETSIIPDVFWRSSLALFDGLDEEVPRGECDTPLELALEDNNYACVKECLSVTIQEMPSPHSSSTIKKCFQELWTKFPSLIIPLIEEDALLRMSVM